MINEIHRYYSQHGEDYLLSMFFDFKADGFYVDVGAFDGVHLSNTLVFENMGWSGICVEANPKYARLCKEARPKARCLSVACTNEDKENIPFYTDELGLLSSLEYSEEKNNDIRKRYLNRGLEFKGLSKINVPVTTLNKVLIENSKGNGADIDFVSIDVEGHEMDVLAGFDIRHWKPRVIVVEANTLSEESRLKEYMVEQLRYIYARKLGVNLFFVKNIADSEKLNSIKIKCVIEKQLHPLGPKYTPSEYIEGKVINQE